MNREIKFRGKDLIHNKWIYGGLVKGEFDNPVILPNKDWRKGGCVDKDTIGQFTGIYDSHHRKVYEGDIIKKEDAFGGTYIVEIRSVHDGVEFVFPRDKRFCMLPSSFIDGDFAFSVIGNIHDNPELIKEK